MNLIDGLYTALLKFDSLHEIDDLPKIGVALVLVHVVFWLLRAFAADVASLQCSTVCDGSAVASSQPENDRGLTCSAMRRTAALSYARSIGV